MNTFDRLLRSRFNPCADRVEAIGQYIDGMLDVAAEAELSAHIETCHRCRRYRLFLEATDRGFHEQEKVLTVVPSLTAELPTRLKEEMVETLKRNLSRWFTDAGRELMYRGGLITPFFLDAYEGKPLETAIERSRSLLGAMKQLDMLSIECAQAVSESGLLLASLKSMERDHIDDYAVMFFALSLLFDPRNHYPYHYQSEQFMLTGKYDKAMGMLRSGLSNSHGALWKSYYLNNMGRTFLFKDDLQGATEYFERAKKEGEQLCNPLPDLNLALCRLKGRDAENALQHFEQALQCSVRMPSARLREGGFRYVGRFFSYYVPLHHELTRDHPGFKALAGRFGRTHP